MILIQYKMIPKYANICKIPIIKTIVNTAYPQFNVIINGNCFKFSSQHQNKNKQYNQSQSKPKPKPQNQKQHQHKHNNQQDANSIPKISPQLIFLNPYIFQRYNAKNYLVFLPPALSFAYSMYFGWSIFNSAVFVTLSAFTAYTALKFYIMKNTLVGCAHVDPQFKYLYLTLPNSFQTNLISTKFPQILVSPQQKIWLISEFYQPYNMPIEGQSKTDNSQNIWISTKLVRLKFALDKIKMFPVLGQVQEKELQKDKKSKSADQIAQKYLNSQVIIDANYLVQNQKIQKQKQKQNSVIQFYLSLQSNIASKHGSVLNSLVFQNVQKARQRYKKIMGENNKEKYNINKQSRPTNPTNNKNKAK